MPLSGAESSQLIRASLEALLLSRSPSPSCPWQTESSFLPALQLRLMLQQAHLVKQRQPKVMLNILLQKAFLLVQHQLLGCLQALIAPLAWYLSLLFPLLFHFFLAWFILLYYKICGSKELFELLSIAFRSLTMITHCQVLESFVCH